MDRVLLAQYGIDYDRGLKNCIGDPAFFQELLGMFLDDSCMTRARAAHAEGDAQALFSSLHELKGACGNAALTGLYGAVAPLVNLLRDGNAEGAEVDRLFAAVEENYLRVCQGIRLALGR